MTTAGPIAQPGSRVRSVDVVRGAAMVLMVLDHTRDFVHEAALRFDPVDISQTDPATFLSRWITHIVAPTFVLLAGVGAALQLQRGVSRGALARYLLIRGLILIVLELTVVRVGIWFSLDPSFVGLLQVIWVLGVSMIVLAGLVFVPPVVVAVGAIALIVGHNAFDTWTPPSAFDWLWTLLHRGGALQLFGAAQPNLLVLYPLLPWVAVMALGFLLGGVYRWEARRRRRFLVGVALALIACWVVLRFVNVYGDPTPWETYPDAAKTVMSFLNAEKYPPSLVFLLMTLGPTLLLLGLLEGRRLQTRVARWLEVIGRAPLVFYLLQWYVAHGLAVVAGLIAGQDVAWQFLPPPDHYIQAPPNAGFPLPVVYLVWIVAIVILTPIVARYAALRASRGGVLRYF
jgi:uncharacterized membrane protein